MENEKLAVAEKEKTILVKELDKKVSANEIENQTQIVDHAHLLLSQNASKEREILRELKLDGAIAHLENIQEHQITMKVLKENHQEIGAVYPLSEIEKLAMKYRLKFGFTKHFTGAIPPDLAAALLRAYDKKGIIANKSDYNAAKFRILAPYKMFNDNPKLKIKFEVKFNTDPLVFCQADEAGQYWVLIKAWGNDFLPKRQMLGSLLKTVGRVKTLVTISFIATILGILKLCFFLGSISAPYHNIPGYFPAETWSILGIVVAGLVGILLTIFYIMWMYNNKDGIEPLAKDVASDQTWMPPSPFPNKHR